MRQLKKKRRRFLTDETGATALEYALIAAFVSVVIVGVVFTLGVDLVGLFQSIADIWPG
jgi:pilus assembly protein Flp/PilA